MLKVNMDSSDSDSFDPTYCSDDDEHRESRDRINKSIKIFRKELDEIEDSISPLGMKKMVLLDDYHKLLELSGDAGALQECFRKLKKVDIEIDLIFKRKEILIEEINKLHNTLRNL